MYRGRSVVIEFELLPSKSRSEVWTHLIFARDRNQGYWVEGNNKRLKGITAFLFRGGGKFLIRSTICRDIWGGVIWLNQRWIQTSSIVRLGILNWFGTGHFQTDFFSHIFWLKHPESPALQQFPYKHKTKMHHNCYQHQHSLDHGLKYGAPGHESNWDANKQWSTKISKVGDLRRE